MTSGVTTCPACGQRVGTRDGVINPHRDQDGYPCGGAGWPGSAPGATDSTPAP